MVSAEESAIGGHSLTLGPGDFAVASMTSRLSWNEESLTGSQLLPQIHMEWYSPEIPVSVIMLILPFKSEGSGVKCMALDMAGKVHCRSRVLLREMG